MDRTDHSVDFWIAEQIPSGAVVLELCAGNGDRSLRLLQRCEAAHWQLTDRDYGDINQAMLKAKKLEQSTDCWAMPAEQWQKVRPETTVVLVRNALHVLSPKQIRAICQQTHKIRATLIIANCFDLQGKRTAEFQENVIKTNGFVWPLAYIMEIAHSEGLSLREQAEHRKDEACEMYGKITTLALITA